MIELVQQIQENYVFPYLDHNFVINSLALKPNLKIFDGYPKYPLRKYNQKKTG